MTATAPTPATPLEPGPGDGELVVRVENVRKSFKQVIAVDDISLSIRRGQFVALLGPNGAGKTTLVEMIEGIQQPDSGTIRIKGLCWGGNEERLHRAIGISLQETRFFDKLTVLETLRLFASFYGLGPSRIREVMDLVDLEEKNRAYVVNLSGGQRQRLALGIALLNRPEVLLLDEPTTGLDPAARKAVWNILLGLRDQGDTSMLLTTHYMEEAEELCDHIVMIDQGKIIRQGLLQDLLRQGGPTKKIDFSLQGDVSDDERRQLSQRFGVRWSPSSEIRGVLLMDDNQTQETLHAFFDYTRSRQLPLAAFECKSSTLNDLFLSLTGRHLSE